MSETIGSTRRGFLDFSPIRGDEDNKENDIPVLSLLHFSKAPFLTFGNVKLGTSKSAILQIDNPSEDVEAEVTVEKIPSSKGFSVDRNRFTIQPECSSHLTVTWTPTEEGGIRELLVFCTNGVLKSQAVMLGRAEAPKKKKKSLWDSIKNKQAGEKVGVSRRKVSDHPRKMAANKTFQVSRKSQYKREKPCSPLASLNKGGSVRARSLSKRSPLQDHPGKFEEQKAVCSSQSLQTPAASDQENVFRVQRNSSSNFPLLTENLLNCSSLTASPDACAGKPDNKDLARMLNKTLSPIGTPERFKKIMPHIYSDSPLSAAVASDRRTSDPDSGFTGTPVPSLKDALALIDSDLSHINSSPQDTSSSCSFSDSLNSRSGGRAREPQRESFKTSPDGPSMEPGNQPPTFFVGETVTSPAAVPQPDKATLKAKKSSFVSVTVTKGKAPAEVSSLSGRKMKKSRRRLLEKTLELCDGSSCESAAGSPSLPVIELHVGEKERQESRSEDCSFTSRRQDPPAASSVSTSSPTAAAATSLSPLSSLLASELPSPASARDDQFPVHTAAQGKKRKSEEFRRNDGKVADAAGRADRVKRSRVAAAKAEPSRSVQERRSVTQRQQARTAGSVRSTLRAAPSNHTKQPSSKMASQGPNSLKSSRTSSVRTARVVAVAQSKLTFVKPVQTAIPRHPMPFAAKNMFYDERWIEKQERGFTWWINYVLTPDDFKVNTEVATVSAVSIAMGSDDNFSVPKAPTKEEMSLSTYTARRKLNRLRRSACQLFTSEAMVKAIRRLELEVESKRLLVRKDRHLWKDIGERRKVLNWLLAYNPLWLRIGLETIYGELISLESNNDTLGLAMFILQRLLWNPDIAAEFRHAKVPNLYKDGHEEALSRFTLKKLLLLVCFLDKAKESRLIEHDPCMFCMDAEFKTSKDLLLAFSRDFLSGEGILPRHLGYLGLPVSHVQRPLDEFNFAVKNLAVDLKCGIRLVRVMELLTQDWTLSSKLRLPAISRLQKVHNVDVALQMLRSKGVDLKDERGSSIESKDIVDGHREKTLGLLWKIMFAFHVEVILDENQLVEEIGFLKTTLKTKRNLASLRAGQGLHRSPAEARKPYEHSSTKISLLMDWVRTVSDFYNLKVENFTVAFSDGRVLCYLIHHYHPALLPDKAVSHSTTQTVECSQRGRLELNCSASDSDTSFDSFPEDLRGPDSPSLEFKELLENEKNNFRLVNTAVSYLGGVPAMINPADMSNTIPSEKVVMSYVSFLCARLLDLRNETRAARVIQGAWRKYRLKKDVELYKERHAAAAKIQVLVRSFLQTCRAKRQNKAAVVIQSAWRGYAARNRLRLKREAQVRARRHEAATVIQAQWRMHSALRSYQCLRRLTIVVQAQWRMRKAASAYQRTCLAVATIQKHWRARALAKRHREQYLCLRAAAMAIQSGYRRWKALKTEMENHAASVIQAAFRKWREAKTARRVAAAVKIQSWFRMESCRQQYRRILSSAVLIQACFRGSVERSRFRTLRQRHRSAVAIQRVFRGHTARKQLDEMRCAALVIQRWFRASLARDVQRRQFVRMRCAAIVLQAAYRGKATREALKVHHQAATAIQAAFRKYAAQRSYLRLRKAATLLQQRYRAAVLARQTRAEYVALRNAAVAVQAAWRGRAVREQMERRHRCATLIQACYQGYRARAKYAAKRAAAVAIQRRYRAHQVGRETRDGFLRARSACLVIQAAFRGMMVRRELKTKHHAATVIQSAVRMYLCRKNFVLLQSAAIIVQSRYRALVAGRVQRVEFSQLKQAATKIQATYRGFMLRRDLERRHEAATVIQAQFRMHRARTIYLAMKCAAIIIQERHRARLLGDQHRRQFMALKSAVLTIQAAYRGLVVRLRVSAMHHAAAVIQRKFLVVRERRRFLAIRSAVVVCQRRYRVSALARKERSEYEAKHRAVVLLQAAYRGNRARKQLRVQCRAAVTIQSHFRKHLQRVRYLELRWAAHIVQARYRACRETRREMQLLRARRDAAVSLQAAFRGRRVRKEVALWHGAATVIQTEFRRHKEQVKFQAVRFSAIIIQRFYRAHVLQRREREQFLQVRRSAIILQAAYRGRQSRKELVHKHQAATVIQSAFRKHREQVKFQALRLSAIIIQRFYRSCVLQRQEKDRFSKVRRSAIVLQAAFRGWQARKELARKHQAATVIQSAFRQHREAIKFKAMRVSAVLIQRFYRSWVLQRKEREEFLRMRHSAIVLQAAFRGRQVRGDIAKMNRAATVIQASFKRHKQQSAFQRQRRAALVLQQRFRARKLGNAEMQRYQRCKRAALALQVGYRGMMLRRRIKQMHAAASTLQRAFRSRHERRQYLALRTATVATQRRYRATAMARDQMAKYQKMRQAAVLLQAAFRGRQARKGLAYQHQAATVIQSAFRGYKQQVQFKAVRLSAIVIQRFYRNCVLQRRERERFLEVKRSAIVLQAAFRGFQARKELAHKHQAATVIQSAFRKHGEVVRFKALRLSAILIQRFYRSCLLQRKEKEAFVNMRRSAIVLQAAFRGAMSRRALQQQHRAAGVLQRAYRARRQRKEYLALKSAVVTIQKKYRATVEARVERARYLELRSAAVAVQAAFRGQRVRKEAERRHQAATVVQSAFRRHREEVKFKAMRLSTVLIQRFYRSCLLQRKEKEAFLNLRRSAIVLQAAFRGMMSRKALQQQHRAAGILQRAYRARRQRKEYLTLKWSVVTIQKKYRATVEARVERARYLELRSAAVAVQAAFRGQRVRKEAERRHQAATVVQSAFRRHREEVKFKAMRLSTVLIQRFYRSCLLQRKEKEAFLNLRRSAIVLQAAFRGMMSRKALQQQHRAAGILQRAYRARRQRKEYLTLKWSVVTIQKKYRATVEARVERARYLELRSAAVAVQAAFRGQRVRKEAARRHQAATVVQSAFRRHREEVKFKAMRLSTVLIQRFYRACKLQRRDRGAFLELRRAAVALQAAFRGRRVRREDGRRSRAAAVLQARWRGRRCRRSYLRERDAAVALQRRFRAALQARADRERYIRMRVAAITLQTYCRAWFAKRQALEIAKAEKRVRFTSAVFHHLSAIKIQRAVRAHWALENAKRQIHSVVTIQRWVKATRQRKRYLDDRRNVVTAQRAARRWLARRHQAASVIQRAVRNFLLLRRQRKFEQGVIKAQALWRGHRSRQLHDNPKVVKLRQRFRKVSANVQEEDKLRHKTSVALDYLLRYKHFSYILEALKNLEIATRLSPECCERLVESGATDVIFTLIRCCNRSVPCMDVITFSIQILLNLSKYHKTVEAVYSVDNSVETLLDLLQRYREKAGDKVAEKGGSIFTKACFLLALLLQDRGRATDVMKLPKALDRIRSIYRLTLRKHKMDAERSVIKHKMNASINGSFFIPATPRKLKAAPQFAPDWVLRKDKLKDIVDPLRAIEIVAKTLSIVL